MAGVLALDAVVPREESNFQTGQPGSLDLQEAVFQLLPEARGGPVLDGEAGPLGDLPVLVAVEPLKLVAEPEGVGTAVPALAQLIETEAQRFADGQQPLEVGCTEPEDAAIDSALGADELGVAFPVLRRRVIGPGQGGFAVGSPVDDPQLVHQNFLGRPRLLERRGIDHSEQSRNQELIGEHRELADEVNELGVRCLSVAEPAGIGIVSDDAMME